MALKLRQNLILFLGLFTITLLLPGKILETQNESPRTIWINDNGLHFPIQTDKKLVAEILFDLGLYLKPEDRIYPSLSEETLSQIIIERATRVTILADGEIKPKNTFQKRVAGALQEAAIHLGPEDELNYTPPTPLFSEMEIVVTRVRFDTLTKTLSIPHKTISRKDNTLAWGKTKIAQEGKNGLKKQTYKIIYKNNKEYQRILEKEEILEKPEEKIILEGTKVVVGKPYYGVASYYRYGNKLTCASTQFSKGASLRVTNTQNGKEVIVMVNDTGPFVPGRIIDLNVPAFEKIASLGAGLVKVKVEKIIK